MGTEYSRLLLGEFVLMAPVSYKILSTEWDTGTYNSLPDKVEKNKANCLFPYFIHERERARESH